MSKKSKKQPFQSVLASSPEELAERMKDLNAEIVGIGMSYLTSDFHRMILETRAVDSEILSKKGIKHLGKALFKVMQENPDQTMLLAAKAVLWVEKTAMTRRGARKAVPAEMTSMGWRPAVQDSPAIDTEKDDFLDVDAKIASRKMGQVRESINSAYHVSVPAAERPEVDRHLDSIGEWLSEEDFEEVVRAIEVMVLSQVPSVAEIGRGLLTIVRPGLEDVTLGNLPVEEWPTDVDERVVRHLREIGLDIETDPEGGPGHLRLVDMSGPEFTEIDRLHQAINRAYLIEVPADQRPLTDGYLNDINQSLREKDLDKAKQQIGVMCRSNLSGTARVGDQLVAFVESMNAEEGL